MSEVAAFILSVLKMLVLYIEVGNFIYNYNYSTTLLAAHVIGNNYINDLETF